MSNFEIHELTEKAINRNSNIIHDTLYGEDYETGKNLAGAVADLNNVQIASEYDDTATYAYGAYCIKDGVLYRCTTAISVAEAWDSTHWTAVMVTGEYKRVRIMTKAQFDLLSNDEKDGFIYVSDYPTKIQDIDNVTLTTSDNNKLLGVSVSGSDISVGAVAKSSLVSYTEIDVAFDSSGEGTLFTTIKYVLGLTDVVGGAPYVGYMSFISAQQVKVKNYNRSSAIFESVIKSATRKIGVYYLNI